MKIGFFEIKDWERNYIQEKLAGHTLYFYPNEIDEKNLPVEKDFDIISVFTNSRINKELVEVLPKLKLVTTRTTGIDHIDQTILKERKIELKNVPTYGSNSVAEYTFALLLNYSRKISDSIERVKEEGNFDPTGLQGFDLVGKTIGVIGTGNIGREVIKLATAFGMNILAYDVEQNLNFQNDLGFKYTSLENLLSQADIITLHVPYLESTHHLINQNNIEKIKNGAILINTARGAVVETKALVKALEEKILGAALLDVLEEENFLKSEKKLSLEEELPNEGIKTLLNNHTLINMENVYVTPHNAFNTKEALIRILDTTIGSISGFLQKVDLPNHPF